MCNSDSKLDILQSQEITSENWKEEQKRQQLTDNAFGTNLPPKLEKVEFKVGITLYVLHICIVYYAFIQSVRNSLIPMMLKHTHQ